MKNYRTLFCSLFIIFNLFFSSVPKVNACGPSPLVPVFEYQSAPENPYQNFANGKIGIIKPTFPRIVLFAAYRYLNNGGFSVDEQKGLVEAWESYFNNKSFEDDDVAKFVKLWVEKRKSVIKEEKNLPQIYVERSYGGYDFFPNCSSNAFEVATETLQKRINDHGIENKDVIKWVKAQDKVFMNCASGKINPEEPDSTMPEWLQKDRKYQIAAAEFYSMNFPKAKSYFAEIADDSESSWQEVSKYLVGRTLIRQASLTKSKELTDTIYAEAEQVLQTVSASGGKYSDSAEKLIGLIKYRTRPEERVSELAQNLSFYGGDNFRQDLIDFTWLLDKFEAEALRDEEKRIESQKPLEVRKGRQTMQDGADKINDAMGTALRDDSSLLQNGTELLIFTIYSEDYQQSWRLKVPIEATDADAYAEAEKLGITLTDKIKENIRSSRLGAYLSRFGEAQTSVYEGGYNGEVERSFKLLPDFLTSEELTSWLFAFQLQGPDSYQYSYQKYEQTGSDLWLLTTISKADQNSPNLSLIMKVAKEISPQSTAYPTIFYHLTRLLIAQGKKAEARKLIDGILNSSIELPISTQNQFKELKMDLAETLEEFLQAALKKPFTFSQSGTAVSIERIIAERKSYYDPKYDKVTRAEFEKKIDEEFREHLEIKNELMLDYRAVDVINQNFPLSLLKTVQNSDNFPKYLKKRLARAIWTKSVLIRDFETADLFVKEFVNENENLVPLFETYLKAPNETEKHRSALMIILKNRDFTPYLTGGLGHPDESYSGGSKWWCRLEEEVWDDKLSKLVPKIVIRPGFITEKQQLAAQNELKQLKLLGDAPAFLTKNVLEWAGKAPRDKRIEEGLYLIYEANDWDKYGCGGDISKRKQISGILKRKYPNSSWTQKLFEEEN